MCTDLPTSPANTPHRKRQTHAKVRASAASVLPWITLMILLCILISIRKAYLFLYHLYDCPIPSIRNPHSPIYYRIPCQLSAEGFIQEENIALKVCLYQWHTPVTGRTQKGWQQHKLASQRWVLTVCRNFSDADTASATAREAAVVLG